MNNFLNLFLFVAVMLCSTELIGQEEVSLLTLGESAPLFDPDEYVVGESFEIDKGRVYVIEFSGTHCLPCIQAIPEMERLQDKYSDVVFASVFNESSAEVSTFLSRHGKKMTSIVISDPDQSLKENWCDAAGFSGIPHVVVVDKAGRIAWMGRPSDLEVHLAEIVTEQHNYLIDNRQKDIRYLKFLTLRARKQRLSRDREATDLNDSVTRLFKEKKYSEIVMVCDQAIQRYSNLPIKDAFRARKLLALGLIPKTQRQGYELAKQLIVEDSSANGFRFAGCKSLANHYQNALQENKDERFLRLILAHLAILEKRKPVGADWAFVCDVRARAYFLLGESDAACKYQEMSIRIFESLLNKVKPGTSQHEDLTAVVEMLNSRLEKYRGDATKKRS